MIQNLAGPPETVKHGAENQYYFRMVAIHSPETPHYCTLRFVTRISPSVLQMWR